MSATTHVDPDIHIARRVEDILASSISRINARAEELAGQGHEILRLDAGEPDFATPTYIVEAAKQALDDGFTHYTPNGGLPELKHAIAGKFKRENNLHYDTDEIIATCGVKQAFFDSCMTLVSDGDEVVIPTPHWSTYPAVVEVVGGTVVQARAQFENGFILTADELDAALSSRTRVVVLNSPTNPTGQVYGRKALSALGNVLLEYPNVFVVSDEIYEHIRYADEPYCSILNVCPSLKRRTLVLNGVSKAYAMTGWRVGFAAGPAELIAEMQKLQGQSTSATAAVSQKAAEAALNGGLDSVHNMARQFGDRAHQVAQGLAKIDAIDCHPAQGSFYCLPDFSKIIDSIDGVEDDQQLGDWLLDELGIAMVPGSAFGAPGHMRLSFAAGEDTISEGLRRLQKAFA